MRRRAAIISIVLIFAALAVSVYAGGRRQDGDLQTIAGGIRAKFEAISFDGLNYEQKQAKIDCLLADLGINVMELDSLSDLKSIYSALFVDPCLEDNITAGIDRAVKDKIDGVISLSVRGKKYAPAAMYVVNDIDPVTYRCVLEGGYADDSLHLAEVAECVDQLLYKGSEVFSVDLANDFRFMVKPRVYVGRDWESFKPDSIDNKMKLPSGLSSVVLFAVIEQKDAGNRKYKVLWVV